MWEIITVFQHPLKAATPNEVLRQFGVLSCLPALRRGRSFCNDLFSTFHTVVSLDSGPFGVNSAESVGFVFISFEPRKLLNAGKVEF